jgi:hypothetical protein
MEAYHEQSAFEFGQPDIRLQYRASKAVANDPVFDESIYTIPIPPGYTVHDKVMGLMYKSGFEPEELLQVLEGNINETMTMLEKDSAPNKKSETTQTSNSKPSELHQDALHPKNSPPNVTQDEKIISNVGGRYLIPIVICVIIAMLLSIHLFRVNRRSRLIKLIFVSFIILNNINGGSTCIAKNVSSWSHSNYHSNCGLNATYITLRLSGFKCDLEKLAQSIGTGKFYQHRLSMRHLKNALQDHGMEVKALKVETIKDLLQLLEPDNVIIVRLLLGYDRTNIGHYVVLKQKGHNVAIIDPTKIPRIMPLDNVADDWLLTYSTGEFLVAATPKRTTIENPAILLDDDKIDLVPYLGIRH